MNYKHILSSVLVLTVLAVAPVTVASAHTNGAANFWTNGSVGAFLSADGVVRVMGATITAVSGNVINATTAIGGTVLNWIVNTDAATKVVAAGSVSANTSALAVGDKILFGGTATATSGPATVVKANVVVDATSMKDYGAVTGTVAALSTTESGTFQITTKKGATVTVKTNASTVIKLNNATSTFSSIAVGSTITAKGLLNTDGTVITASNVTVKTDPVQPKDWKKIWNEWKDGWKTEIKNDNKDNSQSNGIHAGLRLGLGHFLNLH